jgi:hypothetical protein
MSNDGVFEVIANVVKRYRQAVGIRGELANHKNEEVAMKERDMRVLLFVARAPRAVDELTTLLRAVGIDPQKLASAEPATMRALRRTCISCSNKHKCGQDVAAGTAARHYRVYCPNAMSLDALLYST